MIIGKLAGKSSRGVSGKTRLAAEIIIALFVGFILYFKPGFNTQVTIPFFKTVLPNLGWGYILLCVFIIVGAANAVNLTDGLDGLATGPAIICFATYLLFAYFAGNVKVAQLSADSLCPRRRRVVRVLRSVDGRGARLFMV